MGEFMERGRSSIGRIAGVGTAATLAWIAFANAGFAEDAKIKVGTLTCKGNGGVGLIVGSKEKLKCTYEPAGKGPARQFDGTITKIGLDIGIKGPSVIIWTVLGSTTSVPGDALGGTFAGVAADASLGLGAGAQVLVGGNKKSVVLQPLSVKGETGVNIAVGVSGLKLVPR
jgi:hypothetical protein